MVDFAVLDTSVILLVVAPLQDSDPADRRLRRERTVETLREYRAEKVRFVVPAPVVAELAAGPPSDEVVISKLLARMGGGHVEPLDDLAARDTGLALRKTLRSRPAGERRNGIKFDAMIAGIAHRMGARYLLTANERDFRRYLEELNSRVEVVDVSSPRNTGQLRLVDQ